MESFLSAILFHTNLIFSDQKEQEISKFGGREENAAKCIFFFSLQYKFIIAATVCKCFQCGQV